MKNSVALAKNQEVVCGPSLSRMLGEVRALPHRLRFNAVRHLADAHDGAGRAVMVLPGFMVHDVISIRLRRTLAAAGYDPCGWGMGVNAGLQPDTMDRLIETVESICTRKGPVALVGWSLGGLYGRELAKLRPELVERVITLASPFSGDPRANNVWRIYERVAGHPVDAPPLRVDLAAKPPVPTIALSARRDGLVSPACAYGMPGERDVAVMVECSHLDIVANPRALDEILKALALRFD